MQSATRDSVSSTVQPPTSAEEEAVNIQRVVRSIPPWVQAAEDDDVTASQRLLPPGSAVAAKHHYLPAPPQHKAPGRKWDHLRDAEPALLDQPLDRSSARWLPYMLSGPQPRGVEGARLMTDEWMEENTPDLTRPWNPSEGLDDISEKNQGFWLFSAAGRRDRYDRMQHTILKNPFIPLAFRLTVLAFSLVALGLGARIIHQTNSVRRSGNGDCVQRASTYMAVIVDSVAVPYLLYVTWDEYFSKPLGLRSASAKISLILFDLYFIVFQSSNLSLAFDALRDHRWACYTSSPQAQTCPHSSALCKSQEGLASVLIIATMAWLITFSISVLRVIERLR